jgi:hypothetical protein
MTAPLRAIETVYHGYRFRSRLEARWAVFFDSLGVPFEYEKEGFELEGAGRYLPDFWLPQQECWIEIKPVEPNQSEQEKAGALALATGHPVALFIGNIPDADELDDLQYEKGGGAYYFFTDGQGYDCYYAWCQCPICGKFGIEFDGRTDRLPCKESFCCWHTRDRILSIKQALERPGSLIEKMGYWKELGSLEASGCPICSKSSSGCRRTGGNGDKGYNVASPRLKRAYLAARQARFEFGARG